MSVSAAGVPAAGVPAGGVPATGDFETAVTRAEVEELAREVGDAFYLVDLDRLRENHDLFLGVFRRRYPDTVLAYSVKTNYTPRVLAVIRELGSVAEVVSELEHEIVSRVGFPAGEILVNGPFHRPEFLEKVFLQGTPLHLDGWYMLETLHRVAAAHPGKSFRVGVRLNYPIPGAGWSRFGFETTDADMRRLADWFHRHPNCRLEGLHSHFPLAPKSAETFRGRMEGLVNAARTWFAGAPLRYLDLGGGFGDRANEALFAEVAEAVAEVVEAGFPEGRRPTLYVEPGSAVVASAVAFVARVYDVKSVEGRTLALVDGSTHNFNTMMWHSDFAVRVLRAPDSPVDSECSDAEGPFAVMGNTCMERKDVICTGVPGPVARGDYVVFDRVGAYSTALKPPFIHTCPPMVARQGGEHEVVKVRETADDVLRTFRFAEVER